MIGRRGLLASAVVLGAGLVVREGFPGPVMVPAELQAELLSKLVVYDRNFEARAQGEVITLLVAVPRDAQSTSAAATMKSALSRLGQLGGRAHRELILNYSGPEAVAKACRAEHAAIVYFTSGFDDQVEAVGAALRGVDVLTVAGVADYVPRGVVLGFELVSGKPKLVLNLSQARSQNVNFSADVLKLMRVYR